MRNIKIEKQWMPDQRVLGIGYSGSDLDPSRPYKTPARHFRVWLWRWTVSFRFPMMSDAKWVGLVKKSGFAG
jgi:hypothetical protein